MTRRGYTLIEMLAVLSAGTVLLSITAFVLHLLMQAEQAGRTHVHQASVSGKLAEQFRSDVRTAWRQSSGRVNMPYEARFVLSDNRIVTYGVSEGEVERREYLHGRQQRQESYALPAECSATIKADKKATPHVISLVIMDDTSASAKHTMCIDAILGKDLRFSKRAVRSK